MIQPQNNGKLRMPVVYIHPESVPDRTVKGPDQFLDALGARDLMDLCAPTRCEVPGVDDWSKKVLGGSLTAAQIAAQYGLGIARHGGFHNAGGDYGTNRSAHNDILFVAEHILRANPRNTIHVIDTDAHMANGLCRSIDKYHGRVVVFDLHNECFTRFIPQDHSRHYHPRAVSKDISDDAYLAAIGDFLKRGPLAPGQTAADFIIYVPGYDLLQSNPHGRMRLRPETLIARDQAVFDACRSLESAQRKAVPPYLSNPPFLVLPGGGETAEADKTFGQSAKNLLIQFSEARRGLSD